MGCSASEGWSAPGPTVTVTSNHWPRFTESGAEIFGVCFGSYEVCDSLNSGVNCSSCPACRSPAIASRTPRTTNMVRGRRMLVSCRSALGHDLANLGEQLAGTVGLGEVRGG